MCVHELLTRTVRRMMRTHTNEEIDGHNINNNMSVILFVRVCVPQKIQRLTQSQSFGLNY